MRSAAFRGNRIAPSPSGEGREARISRGRGRWNLSTVGDSNAAGLLFRAKPQRTRRYCFGPKGPFAPSKPLRGLRSPFAVFAALTEILFWNFAGRPTTTSQEGPVGSEGLITGRK